MTGMAPIRWVLSDVDGCVTPGSREPWDVAALGELAAAVAAAGGRWGFSLCTGRPAAYVEALASLLGLCSACFCENGAVLYEPATQRQRVTASVDPAFMAVRANLYETVSQMAEEAGLFVEPGKQVIITVAGGEPEAHFAFGEQLRQWLRGVAVPTQLYVGPHAIDVCPVGITKRRAVEWLLADGEVPADGLLVVGDSHNDLPMLEVAVHKACPANGLPAVKALADYISPAPYTRGILDILDRFGLR